MNVNYFHKIFCSMKSENRKKELEELGKKIMEGIMKAHAKMIEEKKINDEHIVVWEKGKVVKIKARDLK
jgi:ATP-dependent RNA circularization protein (DNA/RNA ligase family)